MKLPDKFTAVNVESGIPCGFRRIGNTRIFTASWEDKGQAFVKNYEEMTIKLWLSDYSLMMTSSEERLTRCTGEVRMEADRPSRSDFIEASYTVLPPTSNQTFLERLKAFVKAHPVTVGCNSIGWYIVGIGKSPLQADSDEELIKLMDAVDLINDSQSPL